MPNVPSHNSEMVAAAIALALGFVQVGERTPAEKPVRPEYYLPPSHRPILSEISVHIAAWQSSVRAVNEVRLPAPSTYSGQAVVGLKVTCEPTSAMQSWSLTTDPRGLNSVLKVVLTRGIGQVFVGYEAQILTPNEGVVRLQSRNYKSWLGSSECVQSGEKEIAGIAKALKAGTTARSEFVGRVVKWVASNKLRQDASPAARDAKSAMKFGGDSLGRADLCAAILRAGSVAARVVAAIPTWADRFPAEYWLNEYWTEDGTWEFVDPLVGIQNVSRDSEVVLAVATTEDENDPHSLPFTNLDASIHIVGAFPPQSGARLLMAAVRRSAKVAQSGAAGQETWIDDKTLQRIIKRGPVNLALYLDGHPTMPDR